MLKIARIRSGMTVLLLIASASLLSGCYEFTAATDAATGAAEVGSGTVAAQSLSVSGKPGASVTVGQNYSFAPSVNASAGDVTYSISNKPDWAVFNVVTGALAGKPTPADVGSYANVVISASNGASTASLAAFTIQVVQAGANLGTAALSWIPPTQNTDGTVLNNLAGYHIYQGTDIDHLSKTIQVTNAGLTAYTVADLGSGTHYFGVSAYTSDGVESGISDIGNKTIM